MKNLILIVAILLLLVGAYFAIGTYLFSTDTPEVTDEEVESTSDLLDSAWVWRYTNLLNGDRTEAPEGEQFILSFNREEGQVFSATDCNSMFGTYVADGEVLSFSAMGQTLMYCEGSMESTYGEQLQLVNSYVIEGDTLRLNLNRDYGVMVFERQ